MKFKLGQIVRHKISKKKYVVVKIFPKRLFRKYPHYRCSDDSEDNSWHYEWELEEVKK